MKQNTIGNIKGLTFVGGQITSRVEANPEKDDKSIGKILVIPPKAIQNGKIEHKELYEMEFKTEIDEKKLTHTGDIVVSQDYGVAAMALGKEAYAIHQSGKWYTDDNIDRMLMERHLNKKARRSSQKSHIKGPKKRTEEDDRRFAQSFEKLILLAKSKQQ